MQSARKIILTPLHRVIILVLIIVQVLFFLYTYFMVIHFHNTPLPFYGTKSLVTSTSTETHYLWNISLYLLFWLQHIVMATLKYKLNWAKIWPSFALFERYIYNISSAIVLYILLTSVQPSYIYLFTIPQWISLPLKLYGVAITIKSNLQLGPTIFMPFKLDQILNNKQIELPDYKPSNVGLQQSGIYAYLRHPMQGGFLFIFIFGHSVYTTQRLIFVSVFCVMILIGVLMEESRLKLMYTDYPKYMERVKARFLPYVI